MCRIDTRLNPLQQSPPYAVPWDRTITFQFCWSISVQSKVHRKQAAAVIIDSIWWHKGQYLHWAHGTKASKSMFLIDLIEQKQSLPCVSLMKSSTKTRKTAYYTLHESYFCEQGLCQDLVTAAMMEGRWLLFPSGRIMSSERDTGSLIETCHTVTYSEVGAKQTLRMLAIA